MAGERTPWGAWLRLACARGVAPAAFWRLSLAEWRALTRSDGEQPMTRAGLEALAARFPDESR